MAPVGHVQAMLDKPEPVEPDGLRPIRHGKFELSASGLVVSGTPTLDEWAEIGHVLAVMEHGIQFLVGDWIRYGEEKYGEAAAQVIDHRMWSEETVRGYVWLAKSVPRENRYMDRGLKMKHHQLVAAMPPGQQRIWLRRALNSDGGEGPWPAAKLQAAIKGDAKDVTATSFYLVVKCTDARDRDALMARMQAEGRPCKGTERYEKVVDAPVVAPAAEEKRDEHQPAVRAEAAPVEPGTGDQAQDKEPEPAGEHARRIGRRAQSGVGRYVREHGVPQRKRKPRGGKAS